MRLGHFRVKTFEMVTSFHRLFSFKMHYQHAVEPPESFTREGGGGTWVFRGVHTFVIKIKKYP